MTIPKGQQGYRPPFNPVVLPDNITVTKVEVLSENSEMFKALLSRLDSLDERMKKIEKLLEAK